MRYLLISLIALLSPGLHTPALAQTDSVRMGGSKIEPFAQRIDRQTSTKAYRMTFVSVPLIVGGVVMMSYDKEFGDLRNGHASSFARSYDDYLQYAPMALTYGLKICGVKGRSSWGRMLVSHVFAAGLMATAVNSLKYTVAVERPDGSGRNSFPSGHTATAFMAATILHKEYGHRSPWYSIAGYTMATLTGVTRQLNNRHWMSDVMVGAGIGILTTELGYLLADLIFKDRGLYAYEMIPVFDRYRKPSFFGINVGFTTALGRYRAHDADFNFSSGPTVALQGAWFATYYLGIGGRFSVSSLHVTVNDVAQAKNFESSAAYGGLYFSYPISSRWLIGSKLLGGYEHYKRFDTDYGPIGNRGGAALGTGISMMYVANQNLGVRFTTDYDLTPSVVASSGPMHKLTFGVEACAVF